MVFVKTSGNFKNNLWEILKTVEKILRKFCHKGEIIKEEKKFFIPSLSKIKIIK